jgi:hypothetical protein
MSSKTHLKGEHREVSDRPGPVEAGPPRTSAHLHYWHYRRRSHGRRDRWCRCGEVRLPIKGRGAGGASGVSPGLGRARRVLHGPGRSKPERMAARFLAEGIALGLRLL